MTDTLLFFGAGTSGPTIWTSVSNGSHVSFRAINAAEAVSPLSGGGDALQLPGPVLYFFDDKIYAQSKADQLLVWETHGSVSPANWTHNVVSYAPPSPPHGPGNSSAVLIPQGLCAYLGGSKPLLYFNGTYQPNGSLTSIQGLFCSDGTQSGTTLVAGSAAGLAPSSLAMAFGDVFAGRMGELYFAGQDSSGDNVLFRFDGTNPPEPVFAQNSGVVNPAYLTMSLVGTLSATQDGPITTFSPPQSLFMSGQDPNDPTGTWLWQYDGANLEKFAPAHGVSSSGLQPCELTEVQWRGSHDAYCSAVFFSGVDENNNTGLWMSQGTRGPTTHITGVPAPAGAPQTNGGLYPFNLTAFNDLLFFTAYDRYIGGLPAQRGLFVCDPASGNEVTKLIPSSAAGLDPQYRVGWAGNGQSAAQGFQLNQTSLTVFDNDLFFAASAPSETAANLWRARLEFNAQGKPMVNPEQVSVTGQTELNPLSLMTVGL